MTACPIRYQRQVPDRKGKIFYTSITSLSHISKYKRNEVTLKNGKIIPIAYRNQKDFRKIFWDYLKRRK